MSELKLKLNSSEEMNKENEGEEKQQPSFDALKHDSFKLDEEFTDAEKKELEDFSKKIDINNPDHIMLYGAEAQKKVSDFADSILADVKNKDSGEVGEMITRLVGELDSFDSSAEMPKGLKALFYNGKKHITQMKLRFDSVSKSVDNIAGNLEGHQLQLLKDVAMFNHLYDMNLAYFKELGMYIAAGEKKLEALRNEDLVRASEKANASNSAVDAQAVTDLQDKINRFEKKLYDLKITRQICLQMAPQIRMIQNNDSLLVERIQSTIVNTLPLWKNQMVVALGQHHSEQATKAQRAVTDITNELLKKNAEKLKQGTIAIAKEGERGIVDIETLVETNKALIDTMNEVVKIQQEGRQKRIEAEKTLLQMEAELKNQMLKG